jgi:hypothetical protein
LWLCGRTDGLMGEKENEKRREEEEEEEEEEDRAGREN